MGDMLREYSVNASVILYVLAYSSEDAENVAWDTLQEKDLVPKYLDVIGRET